MIVAGCSNAGYLVLLKFATSLSIVPYLFVSLYAVKSVLAGTGLPSVPVPNGCGPGSPLY